MEKYIKDFVDVIRNGAMDNTYKMAWARSLVEYCCINDAVDLIHFNELAPLVFKYYWDQTIFFDLRQGPQVQKQPVIYQLVKNAVESYQLEHGYQPKSFIGVGDKATVPVEKVAKALQKDVCHRFLKVGNKRHNLYELDKDNLALRINGSNHLKDYADLLFELINYRWSQKLEELNAVPRVSQKVRGTDRENVKRKSLKKHQELLDIENPKRKCFISNQELQADTLSIDHVIPWSFMYSDDLWNLVYVSKKENSSKNNRLPDEELIGRLEKRNKNLLHKAKAMGIKGKDIEELELSVKSDYVRRYWISFKG